MTVWLAAAAKHAMKEESRLIYPLETGGVLLGWRAGDDRIIVGALGPGRLALHGRYQFHPDHKWQVSEIRRIYSETAGDVDYLGDWHTHPDAAAEMSGTDARTLRRIARRVQLPLMMIVSIEQDRETGIGCWRPERRRHFAKPEIVAQELRVFDPPSGWPVVHHHRTR